MHIIYVDGACKGNPGPGGWGVFFTKSDGTSFEIYGYVPDTTNGRMEVQAMLEALILVPDNESAEIFSDSQYVTKGINEWLSGWKKKGWRNSKGTLPHKDLWQKIDLLYSTKKVKVSWIKGHDGHPGNEKADMLANLGASGKNKTC